MVGDKQVKSRSAPRILGLPKVNLGFDPTLTLVVVLGACSRVLSKSFLILTLSPRVARIVDLGSFRRVDGYHLASSYLIE